LLLLFILIEDKKIAGILIEKKYDSFIIGIGINCHQKSDNFTMDFKNKATSISIETGTDCHRISVARRLICSVDHWLQVAEKSANKIVDQWQDMSIQLGHRVTILFNSRKFSGNCIGVDPQKGLILQLDGGAVRMFNSAQSSIVSE